MTRSLSHTDACTQCGKPFSPDDFYTGKKRKDYISYRSICKDCTNKDNLKRYQRSKHPCAYPSCDNLIAFTSTYCIQHCRSKSEGKKCLHPDCDKILPDPRSTYCRQHCHVKMSASAKKRANTPEGRSRMSKAAKAQNGEVWKGRKHTEASKAIIKGKRAKQVFSRESIEKQAAKMRGRPSPSRGRKGTPEESARKSASLLAIHDHLSQKAKERYANETEEQRERRLTNWIAAGLESSSNMSSGTSIETYVAQCLDLLGIEYVTQKKMSYYIVDFYIPSHRIIVEAQGCYWHGCGQCGHNEPWHIIKRVKEQVRTARLEKKGYTVIMLWQHDIYKAMQDGTNLLHLAF